MSILDGVNNGRANSPSDSLFVSAFQLQARLDALSNQALSRGIDLYTKKDYEGAAREFQRAMSINPASEHASAAVQHLAQSYIRLDQTGKAIKAYEAGLARNPTNADLQLAFGNLLFSEDRFEEAVKAYKAATRLDPGSSTGHYALGEGLMRLGRNDEAVQCYQRVIRLEPRSPHGYLGLGKAYAARGDRIAAIAQFDKALSLQRDYYEAVAEKGYLYADAGEIKKARELADFLDGRDRTLHSLLTAYINKMEPPKMVTATSTGTFRYSGSWKTPLSLLDSYFETAGASKTMTVKIVFSKEMDRSSVENIANWSIARAEDPNLAKSYNFGQPVAPNEVALNPLPNFVLYDAVARTATIGFTLSQNSNADATIDPSHIVFKFSGKDAQGLKMDLKADEFSGFSKVT